MIFQILIKKDNSPPNALAVPAKKLSKNASKTGFIDTTVAIYVHFPNAFLGLDAPGRVVVRATRFGTRGLSSCLRVAGPPGPTGQNPPVPPLVRRANCVWQGRSNRHCRK